MAIVGDSLFLSCKVFAKKPKFLLKNQFYGVSVHTPRTYPDVRVRGRVGIRSTLQVNLEEMKVSRSSPVPDGVLGSERELKENGFMSLRKTKLVCTIGPACSSFEQLESLALGGMNIARLNMCHNTREWHYDVIRKIKKLNEEKGFCISLMIDTEGSQMHMVDHGGASTVKAEVLFFFYFASYACINKAKLHYENLCDVFVRRTVHTLLLLDLHNYVIYI